MNDLTPTTTTKENSNMHTNTTNKEDNMSHECDGCGEGLRVALAGVLVDGSDNPECNNPRAGTETHWRYDERVEAK
tara:strand:- start:434 stop:661 length:228 start_codon:yes stop_codon:yes gene_type:complete